MKTRILVLIAAALPGIHGVCLAQSPVQEVIDNAMIQQSRTNAQDIMAILQQQLTEAKAQTQTLNDQLTRMGDPSTVGISALDLIKEDMAKSAENAANGAQREARIRATTGSEVFGDNAYGLVPAVSATATLKDGSVVERDETKYKLQAAIMEDLNQLAEKSKETDERIAQLEQERPNLLQQISEATDQATITKLQAGLQAIDAQIASSKTDLTKSKQDYEILSEKLKLQQQVATMAKAEDRQLERQRKIDAAAAKRAASASGSSTSGTSGSGSGTTSPFSGLRWGGSDGAGTSDSGTTP